MHDLTPQPEKVILVGVGHKGDSPEDLQDNLDELALLCETAGGMVVAVLSQKLDKISPPTYIGKGKAQEILNVKENTGASLIVIDSKLSGIQQRNLAEIFKCKVIDRSQLIIDIFASRAQTREGKLQVELAQLQDQLPRLIGEAIAGLSKLAGGIGTRGPGETKLEMDRRRVKTRIEQVKKDLATVRKTRALQRGRRQASDIFSIALVGYTNSGKSSLLNELTHARVLAENKLFATLDPTTRKLFLPSGRWSVMTDTVGFINRLPTHLIEAFKATFEEINEADLVLQVHDASDPHQAKKALVVKSLLDELKIDQNKIMHVYNKIDLVHDQSKKTAPRLTPLVK
jgi:GTP-binding protein HflX